MKNQIAVRLYENPKYGTTYAKGLRHHAMFNGTIDLQEPRIKYLIDLLPFEHWQHTANTDSEMDTIDIVVEYYKSTKTDLSISKNRTNILCSWIKRFDSNMCKPKVEGFVTLDLSTSEIVITINDEWAAIGFGERLTMRQCRDPSRGQRSPNFLASNYELELDRLAA